MTQKQCTKCKQLKETSLFNRYYKHKDGLTSWCKECLKELASKSYKKNKDKILKYAAEYREKNRIKNQIKSDLKEKHCNCCGQTKTTLEFNIARRNKDGFNNRCKECCVKYHRQFYKENKDKIFCYKSRKSPEYKKQLKKCRDKVKVEVFTHYCNGKPRCIKCGIDDIRVLCLDHINSDGKIDRKINNLGSGSHFYFKIKKLGYPNTVQVLCANCNLIKQYELNEWGSLNTKSGK